MSEELELNEAPQGFDLNDPALLDYVPEGADPEADLVSRKFGPPDDGDYWLRLKLRPETERLPANPYVKGVPGDTNVIAAVGVRVEDAEGNALGFAKDYYLMTRVMKGQPTSSMHFFAKQAGRPFSRGISNRQIIDNIKSIFEQAGEDGIRVYGRVRWNKSVQAITESGDGKVDEQGKKVYREVKGQAKVSKENIREAEELFSQQDWSEEKIAQAIQNVRENPHLYYDPISGEEQVVRVEVSELKVPPAA